MSILLTLLFSLLSLSHIVPFVFKLDVDFNSSVVVVVVVVVVFVVVVNCV